MTKVDKNGQQYPVNENGKHPVGRPSSYTPEIDAEICRRLAQGESLRSICEDEHLPERQTVTRWIWDGNHQEFYNHYTQAREAQADYYADEMADIADNGTNDWMKRRRRNGETEDVFNHEHVQRSKLRVETRKWICEVIRPKKYGQRRILQGDAEEPVRLVVGRRELNEEKTKLKTARYANGHTNGAHERA